MTISPEERAAKVDQFRRMFHLYPWEIVAKASDTPQAIAWTLDALEAAEQQVAEMQRVMASCPNVHLVIRTDRRELFDGEYLDARGQVPMD